MYSAETRTKIDFKGMLLHATVYIQRFQYIERTSMHFKSNIFPIASVDREKSEDYIDIYFMTFALKRCLKLISTCCQVMLYVIN